MTNRDRTALRRYYSSVRSWLPCPRKQKRKILDEIKNNVADFLKCNPQANFCEIQDRFGSPQQIAFGYVEDLNTGELIRVMRIRKRLVAIITATVLSILVLWAGFLAWAVIDDMYTNNGYYVDEMGT